MPFVPGAGGYVQRLQIPAVPLLPARHRAKREYLYRADTRTVNLPAHLLVLALTMLVIGMIPALSSLGKRTG